MAHECPECGQTCYCNGDIDDCNYGIPMDDCTHYKSLDCEGHEEWCSDPLCCCHEDELDCGF